MSSGLRRGRFPLGCMSTTETLLSGVCIRKPVGVAAIGVGVAVSLRAGVRMGTYPAGGWSTCDQVEPFITHKNDMGESC